MATNPFKNMNSHTIIIDSEFDALNVYFLLDSATIDIILCDKKYFLTLSPMMTKHITTIIGSHLVSHQIGEVCLVVLEGTHIHVSRVVYSPTSTINLEFPRCLTSWVSPTHNSR